MVVDDCTETKVARLVILGGGDKLQHKGVIKYPKKRGMECDKGTRKKKNNCDPFAHVQSLRIPALICSNVVEKRHL